jgi:hypothetical protein
MTEPTLYQSINRSHMEFNTKESISAAEWEAFVDHFGDMFAEEVAVLAKTYWSERRMYDFEFDDEGVDA